MSLSRKAAKFDLFAKGVDHEALQNAVGFLGNLTSAKVEEAEDLILNAAWHCLQATEEENEAPTRPGFADKLQDTYKTTRKFSRELNSISGYIYPIALQYNLLDIDDDDIKRDALFYNLMEIQSRLPLLMGTLAAVEKKLRKQGLDKGTGRTPNWYKSLNGTAKGQLAGECHSIFEGFLPGKAASTEFGPFNNFCEAVYDIALDVNPTGEGIGIRRYTEEVCRIFKKRAPRQARFNEIRRALRDPNLSEKTRLALIKEQEENIRQLQAIESRYPD